MLIAPSQKLLSSFEAYMSAKNKSDTANPFEMHVILIDLAMSNWRRYLVFLATETNDQVASPEKPLRQWP